MQAVMDNSQLVDQPHPQTSPYVLRQVLEDIPLATEGVTEPISITCVEFWNDNLYVGTSASEILHLVHLPPVNDTDPSQYILASRLEPSGHDVNLGVESPGVQQILLLPGALKACVLCNGTASFYSLPELSPAFPNREPTGVQYIGGYDENQGRVDGDETAIMIATTKRILQVRVGDKLRPVRPNIEYPSCLSASRRDTIACVADRHSYALLEIEHQQKIPLFDISTGSTVDTKENVNPDLSITPTTGHGRSKSLGDFPPTVASRSASPLHDAVGSHTPADYTASSAQQGSNSRPTTRPRSSTAEGSPATFRFPSLPAKSLAPHILSPFANEFMLTTGTSSLEPGVGIFVNLDGDVSRGTVEFDYYPDALVTGNFPNADLPNGTSEESNEEDLVIVALFDVPTYSSVRKGLQIQTIPSDTNINQFKIWVDMHETDPSAPSNHAGLHQCLSPHRHVFAEVAQLLQAVQYGSDQRTFSGTSLEPSHQTAVARSHRGDAPSENDTGSLEGPSLEYGIKRSSEELAFVRRLGHVVTHTCVWSKGNLWHLLPNPILLRFEKRILDSLTVTQGTLNFAEVNVPQLLSFLGSVREYEPKSETDFLSIKYARQKASVILFLHLLTSLNGTPDKTRTACKLAENALLESDIDPRIPLSLLQPLSTEVLHGSTGLWVYKGVVDCLKAFTSEVTSYERAPIEFWMMLRHFLSSWQEKRGASGSLSDEKSIFDSVDAALLSLLLHLDQNSSNTESGRVAIRAKLNNVVDHWKGDFERAVELLEDHKRLFILSRLYQSKKSAKDVLRIWKRICDGEGSGEGDVTTHQIYTQMRRYLPQLRDASLVKEYAIWLAQRSPDLAIQVLSDDSSRIKFTPTEVVPLLKKHAPGSVQLFLEHLVFAKNLDQYADDLVGYYLDSVLSVLEHSEEARQSLADSYTTYRALTSPKPTYLNFIVENAPSEAWWQSRLRLLQLLGSGGYATTSDSSAKTLTYSIEIVLDRLAPFSSYLVSESIILDARQGRHHEALTLLVHGLGDYDTAVRYCYFGGPTSPLGTIDPSMLPPRLQQEEQFRVLFGEFLKIEDVEERVDRTSHLLGTFATWFDPLTVLESIPESWSVSLLSQFLVRTFRAATTERNQAVILKALSAAQNLQKQADFIHICEKLGASLEADHNAPQVTSTDNGVVAHQQ